MPSHPTQVSPLIKLKDQIVPSDVWTHLSEYEQQTVGQTLTRILNEYLQVVTDTKNQEAREDGFDSEQL